MPHHALHHVWRDTVVQPRCVGVPQVVERTERPVELRPHLERASWTLLGDSVTDVEAARRADASSIAFANKPDKRNQLLAAHPDALVSSLLDIVTATPKWPVWLQMMRGKLGSVEGWSSSGDLARALPGVAGFHLSWAYLITGSTGHPGAAPTGSSA